MSGPERYRYGLNRHREEWFVRYQVKGGRARGKMYDGSTLVREKFDVAIKQGGAFSVDIGTGSGVKINFKN